VNRTARLWAVLVANLALVAALAGVGIAANSLGVFAAGVDYLADAAAIGVSLLAVYLSNRPPSKRHPYGYPRATRLAAAVNAGWLLVLSCLVAAAAAYRLLTGEHRVDGLPVLVVSAVAALVMSGGAVLLGGGLEETGDEDDGEDLNLRAVLLDTAADAAAAAGVAAAGAIIYISHGIYWLDAAVALVIAAVVAYHAERLLSRILVALRS
jgi:cobalt-zinc-cadmium efflux system protein